MNKIIPTTERIFMCIAGASGTGKTQLILSMLTIDPEVSEKRNTTFQPQFKKVIYFYRHWQNVYDEFLKRLGPSTINFLECTGVDSIHQIYSGVEHDNTLLVFDDSCEEILQSVEFANLATSGRHKGLHVIFIKHNLYQQGKYSVTVDKNTTHIILMKSPRIGKQLKILGSEIDGASVSFLEDCYKKATSHRYGHLLIDLSPGCNDYLRFCSNITGENANRLGKESGILQPTIFWIPEAGSNTTNITLEDDEQTNDIYAKAFPNI